MRELKIRARDVFLVKHAYDLSRAGSTFFVPRQKYSFWLVEGFTKGSNGKFKPRKVFRFTNFNKDCSNRRAFFKMI